MGSAPRVEESGGHLACERLGQLGSGTPFAVEGLQQLVSEIDWELRGAGRGAYCTLALAWVQGAEAHVLTVGDSPVYRLRRGRLTEAGADASGTVQRSLRAYLGMGTRVSDVLRHQRWSVEPGDLLLLMSDGILDAWTRAVLISPAAQPGAQGLCGFALDEVLDGVDDATVPATRFNDRDAVSPTAPGGSHPPRCSAESMVAEEGREAVATGVSSLLGLVCPRRAAAHRVRPAPHHALQLNGVTPVRQTCGRTAVPRWRPQHAVHLACKIKAAPGGADGRTGVGRGNGRHGDGSRPRPAHVYASSTVVH